MNSENNNKDIDSSFSNNEEEYKEEEFDNNEKENLQWICYNINGGDDNNITEVDNINNFLITYSLF